MPNNDQAKKRLRQDEKKRVHNKAKKSALRTAMKRVLKADTKEVAAQALPLAMKQIDKAAKTNVIHDNAAARFKSQVSRAVSAKG